jgi:hypothetical protein
MSKNEDLIKPHHLVLELSDSTGLHSWASEQVERRRQQQIFYKARSSCWNCALICQYHINAQFANMELLAFDKNSFNVSGLCYRKPVLVYV